MKKKQEEVQENSGVNTELLQALTMLEKEKGINRETLFEAIENSLLTACRNNFGGRSENVHCEIDRETCNYFLYAEKTVVEEVLDPVLEISMDDAMAIDPEANLGDTVKVELKSKEFGRIATQNAKNVILQKIREEERNSVFNEFSAKEHDIVTGTVQRYIGRNISINLGKADAFLSEGEQVRGEFLNIHDRVRVYVLEVKNTTKGPRILVSRTHPELVKKLFEKEVAEVADGVVEIMGISREAGSRTKIAVYSNNPDVDAVGACVGLNGTRVNAVVDELGGEKIDIINWDENPAIFIENSLSPAKVVSAIVDGDEKTAKVVVPDYQLSLAIGKEGQNARLAARLTGFKIDIKSETQAKDAPGFRMEDYLLDEEGEFDEEYYDENGDYIGPEEYDGEYAEGEVLGDTSDEAEAGETVEDTEAADGAAETEEAAEEPEDSIEESDAAEESEDSTEEAEAADAETEESADGDNTEEAPVEG